MELILASASPRRRELMRLYGVPFSVGAADIDETMNPAMSPADEVARVSRLKAAAIAKDHPTAVVVAADTIVVLDGKILGKPKDEAHARQMLTALSGHSHQVMTGCTVMQGEKSETFTEITDLVFRTLSPAQIDRYIATGEPMDKAGAYGIQGGAALFCPAIKGDYYNVMGLPVCRLHGVLSKFLPDML